MQGNRDHYDQSDLVWGVPGEKENGMRTALQPKIKASHVKMKPQVDFVKTWDIMGYLHSGKPTLYTMEKNTLFNSTTHSFLWPCSMANR